MSAEATDKFLKGAPTWVGAIGGGGVVDGVTDVVPLLSTVALPTDTGIELTIDRVDANGAKTPTKKEVIRGKVSGSNIIDCVRGVEGTAQAHSAGAIVEMRLTASMWNRIIDGILIDRDQLGRRFWATEAYSPSGAGTTTFDLASGKIHVLTMPAFTQTLAVDDEIVGQIFIVEIIGNTSQGAVTWFSGIDWPDGIAPTLTATTGKKDVFGFRVKAAGEYDGYIMSQNVAV